MPLKTKELITYIYENDLYERPRSLEEYLVIVDQYFDKKEKRKKLNEFRLNKLRLRYSLIFCASKSNNPYQIRW